MTKATRTSGSEREGERVQAVRRALAVLEALAARPEGATPKEIGRALGFHLSTCYRLLNTLAAAGYAARSTDGLFRIGPRVTYLNHGYLTARRPPPTALPFVHALQLETGETAMLCHLEGDDAAVTAVVAGGRPGSYPSSYAGFSIPAHAVAAGRVLLAWLPEEHLAAYLTRRAAAAAISLPLSDPNALRSELERIRRDGYALDRGESPYGFCCVAAPVVDGGTVRSVSVVVPCERFRPAEPALVAVVLAVARAISELVMAAPERAPESVTVRGETVAQTEIEAALAAIAGAMSRVG